MTTQFNHDYLGYNGTRSRCNVLIFSDDGEHFILFENLGIGTSVTNMSELLATQIVAKMRFNPIDCRFFETYKEYDHETFDEIEYIWSKSFDVERNYFMEAKHAKWKPAPKYIREMFLE
jgi:hypothetical protein